MLRTALGFFLIGLIAMLLGANNIAGVSIELGRIILFVFLALAVLTALASMIGGRGTRRGGMLVLMFSIAAGAYFAKPLASLAEETVGEKVESKVDDAHVDAKRTQRKAKRAARKQANRENVLKNAGDKAKDVGDDVSNTADKTKDKID